MRDTRGGTRALRRVLTILPATVMFLVVTVSTAVAVNPVNVYRFFNGSSGSHFYTADRTECMNTTLLSAYDYEFVAWTVDADSPWANKALYRFFNKTNGSHFYTANVTEKNYIIANLSGTYRYDGVAYYVSLTPNTGTPIHRFFHKKNGSHFYTASVTEKNYIIANLSGVYSYDGIGFYVPAAPQAYSPVDWVIHYAPGGWTYRAPASGNYNCMSYALGYTSVPIWPNWAMENGTGPVSEAEMDVEMAYWGKVRTTNPSEAQIIAYGYSGDVRHVGKVTSATRTEAKWGQLERYSHPWSPYLMNAGDIYTYGGIRRYYR